jgi:hypothetical protein
MVNTKKNRVRTHVTHADKVVHRHEPKQDHVGAPNWTKGSQFGYIQSFMEDWLATVPRSHTRRAVVRKVAILFITKYGWDLEDNPDALDPDPEDLVALDKELAEGNSEDENTLHASQLKALQTVSILSSLILIIAHKANPAPR